jgi:hypothetical protein
MPTYTLWIGQVGWYNVDGRVIPDIGDQCTYLLMEHDVKHLSCTINVEVDWSLKQDLMSRIEFNYDSNQQTIDQNR